MKTGKILTLAAVFAAIFGLAACSNGSLPVIPGLEDGPGTGGDTVTGIVLTPPSLTLAVGGTATLTAANQSGAAIKAVNWSSINPTVAAVDANGTVIGIAIGSATIIAVTTDGGKFATCDVTVSAEAAPVTGVSLDQTSLSLLVGGSDTLSAEVIPAGASNKAVNWTSTNPQVATVDANGMVSALSLGLAIIVATTEDGGKAATCAVSVIEEAAAGAIAVTGVSLNLPALLLEVGARGKLTAAIQPANATNKTLIWASGNPAAAEVDANGNITATGPGMATIYVSTVEGGHSASAVITVNTPAPAGDAIPATLTNVLGRGYDATGRYADSSQNKAAVLDLNKLQQSQRVKRDPNVNMAAFQTITGENIAKYLANISSTVSSTTKAGLGSVASFKLEAGASFSSEQTRNSSYAFATQRKYFITDGYYIDGLDELEEFFTESFKNDVGSMDMDYDQLIRKYGTHVILGGLLGARADYNMSVEMLEGNDISKLGAYVKAHAEAKYWGASVESDLDVKVDQEYSKYFKTDNKEIKTFVYGGRVQYGNEIHEKQDYTNWINSIEGNEVWMDFYPGKLVPLSDLVSRNSAALESALKNYGLTVFFNLNGGSGGSIPYSLTGSTITTLPSGANLKQDGHVFMGWNTRADGSGTNYSAGSSLNVSDNIVLYANWEATSQLAKELDKLKTSAKSGDKITLKVNTNEAIAPQTLSYGGKIVEITLEGVGGERIISLSKAGAMFDIGSGVTLILGNNIKLFGLGDNKNNALVKVNSGGKLIMNEGSTITGNINPGVGTTGVWVYGGTFDMNGGTIAGNTTGGNGAVTISNKGTFTMNGGAISRNTSTTYTSLSGGVYVSVGNFTMNGGTISGNTAAAGNGGGVRVGDKGTFTMNGGTISGNTARWGGGVEVGGGTFTMKGGIISDNTASDVGGGVCIANVGGTFTMTGGTISGNTAYNSGGGVYIGTKGTFTKTGGTITGYASDPVNGNRVTSGSNKGHAVYMSSSKRRETTAGPDDNMNSKVNGAAGGWVN